MEPQTHKPNREEIAERAQPVPAMRSLINWIVETDRRFRATPGESLLKY